MLCQSLFASWVRGGVVLAALAAAGLSALAAAKDDGGDGPSLADQTAAAAEKAYQQNKQAFAGNSNVLVLPGVLANKAQKTVQIWAKATALTAGDAAEFWVIPADSGKDYEALTVAFAKPSDVHKALEFIGMKPGRPVNAAENRFWPKGERVVMTMTWQQPPDQGAGPGKQTTVRAEEMIVDSRTGKPLPSDGLVFVGSHWITPADGGKPIYVADENDSKAIASDYNHRATVLDVPWQALQGAVYGTLKLNPALRFTPGQPIMITLTPQARDGIQRVRDVVLNVSMPTGRTTPRTACYQVTDPAGKAMAEGDSLVQFLATMGGITAKGQDPFVTVQVDPSMNLRSVRDVYAMLMTIDVDKGIRIDAPPTGHLYYRAFFPQEQWLDRTQRLGRPWELHLVEKDHKVAGTLILPADDIDDNNGAGDLKFTVGTPAEMAKILAEKSGKFSQSVYIYAPGTVGYGAMAGFIQPSLKTHPTMFVFLPK